MPEEFFYWSLICKPALKTTLTGNCLLVQKFSNRFFNITLSLTILQMLMKKITWIFFVLLAIIVGLYPAIYFLTDRRFGLLQSKSAALLLDITWNAAFYTHIILGGIALLIGWTQFIEKTRNINIALHRLAGKIYVVAAFLSALSGLYIALYATGGITASIGFLSLGMIWFFTTLSAYVHIKNKRIAQHQKMMIYSYAACFAAVTLRIWLPLLIVFLHDFNTSYRIVSYLCWIPNMIVAYFLVERIKKKTQSRWQLSPFNQANL